MISGIISFLLGILLLQQFSSLPEIHWCWALLLIILVPFLPRHYHANQLITIFILFISGFLWALLRAHWVLDIALPAELQGKDLLATGVIASIPLEDQRKRRFEFDIETLEYKNEKLISPGKVRISWYTKSSQGQHSNEFQNTLKLKAGQRWRFWLRLKQPHGFMNPGGFDYEGWLFQKKIRATGYVRINNKKQLFAKKLEEHVSQYNILIFRQYLYDAILNITSNFKSSGILVALAMGERMGITQEQWQVFRATGTSHLVAISGLHIGLLAGFVYFIVLRAWPYCGQAALYLASPRVAALVALLMATFYAALSGFAVPAQRALIMLSIVMISIFLRHKVQSSQVLSLALLSVLLFDPVAVLSPGFWLSFAAVAIIALAGFGRLKLDKSWKIWGRLQWRISLALIPLLVFLFQQASLISPLANLFAIPIVSFVVVPLVLLASSIITLLPDLATMLFSLSDSVLNALWWLLSYLAGTPMSQWYGIKPSLLSLCLASAGFALLLTPKGWPAKYLGLFLIIPLIFPATHSVKQAEAEVTLLDVGQGLAAVVQTRHHTLLFDTGPKFSDSFDTGAAVVIPFVRQKNIKKLDVLVLSHKDNDHRGGLESIQQDIEIGQILSSFSLKGSRACEQGQRWIWDDVLFEMLNPDNTVSNKKRNNHSCVLRITAGEESLLLSADIEKQAEKRLVQTHYEQLKSTFLAAPHHGSKTSSSQAFLDAVKPEYIFIPVGFRNRYHMPHAAVLQRYKDMNIQLFESYKSGAISVRLGQQAGQKNGQKNSSKIPEEYRKNKQKYWNSRH
ncbi:MAG: DNA internalization-related competence protein ComEC/Rec2 [Gammaproteobacteria bacterium]|nr:DNA internalization-related competence protein ComEC/Rec2 [Gammaproteobacteria bacterium]